jgi:hypothetical protein
MCRNKLRTGSGSGYDTPFSQFSYAALPLCSVFYGNLESERGEQMKSVVRVDVLRCTKTQTQETENILNKVSSRVQS